MTNYYNILGLEADADIQDIKSSYRKLSKKFHPDLNPNDAFFGKMFLQIQEAYEVLSDEKTRKIYDQKLKSNYRSRPSQKDSSSIKEFVPIIENFSVDKEKVGPNEEFTVTWKVKNADFVQIRPLGIVKSEGFDRFKFSRFKTKSVNLILIATNTETGLSARKHIEIFNTKWRPSLLENDRIMNPIFLVLRIIVIILITILIIGLIFFREVKEPEYPELAPPLEIIQ